MSFRSVINDKDYSGFAKTLISENGGMVLLSSKGKKTPVLCQSEKDILREYGTPSSSYPDLFEAIAYTKTAPLWCVSAVHSDALYGGIDISLSGVVGFSSGRDVDTFDFSSYPDISHVFFDASPYEDDLAAKVDYKGGYKFHLTLYKVTSTGNQPITEYDYSLISEKDAFGKSLYYLDVFNDNSYVIPKVNSSFVGTEYTVSGLVISFSGGSRGSTPNATDILNAWNYFQYANKYPVKTFIDTRGDSTVTVNSLISTYQLFSQGISVIPLGYTANQALTYRSDLGLNSADVSLYTNWQKIVDNYNNSFAWISGAGSIGRKYALCADSYDAASPAGIDENSHGGLLSDWQVVDVENDYSDTDLFNLDNAQINPIVKDDTYGTMAYGDKTLQATLSDTSFVGTSRLFKLIKNTILNQVLRLQEFKTNDKIHRLQARAKINNIMSPILYDGWLREFTVVCDETNNTDDVLAQRKFIIDLYVKVTPNSQTVQLNFVKLGQSMTVTEITG